MLNETNRTIITAQYDTFATYNAFMAAKGCMHRRMNDVLLYLKIGHMKRYNAQF